MKSPAERRVPFHFGVVPDVFSQGVVRFSRTLTHVDGLALKNGDVVQGVDGIRWYFDNGVLSDHVRTTVLAKTESSTTGKQSVLERPTRAHPHRTFPGHNTTPDCMADALVCDRILHTTT
jgi:hypothetical protein